MSLFGKLVRSVLPKEVLPVSPVLPTPEIKVMKPMVHRSERVIAGMGSGDSSDVNTYAMFDRLPKAERDAIRARSSLGPIRERQVIDREVLPTELGEGATIPIAAGTIADVMDANYVRDPETKKLKLKDESK